MAAREMIAIQVRVDPAEARKLKRLAKSNDRSVAAEARIAIRNHVAEPTPNKGENS